MTRRILLSIISGITLVLAFAPFNAGFLAWVALVPLLFVVSRDAAGRARGAGGVGGVGGAFFYSFLTGLVFFLGTVYWVVNSMYFYGGIGLPVSVPIMVLLAAFLALYIAVFGLFFSLTEGASLTLRMVLSGAAWVSLEYLRTHMFSGFPWVLLGYSQTPYLPMIQIADLGGIWAVGFLIVMVNTALYFLARALYEREKALPLKEALVAAFLVISVFVYGTIRIRQVDGEAATGVSLNAAVLQGSIDQGVKWDSSYQDKTIEIYRRLSLEAKGKGASLIVWPETAVPFYLTGDDGKARLVTGIAKETGSFVLTGSPSYKYNEGERRAEYFNSAYLISPAGEITGGYDKIHLVPFGEYVPLKKVLFFVKKLTHGVGDFSSGPGPYPVKFEGGGLGVLICYEAIFPEIARAEVGNGATVLVNITNDAWFGRTSAPYQHLEMSRMRAVENRVFLLRAANTGISAIVDPAGRVVEKSRLFEEAVLSGKVRLNGGAKKTFYTRSGDAFAYSSFFFTALFLISGFIKRRQHVRGDKREA